MTLTVDEKVRLITRNLEEVVGEDELRAVLEKRDLVVYWGTAPTGKPHIGYWVPISKLSDFLKAGCEVKVLFANLHAYLDNQKAPWELLAHRTKYYEVLIKAMLTSIGVPIEKLKFVQGTDYQLSREYSLDVYKLSSITSIRDAQKAGAEVVKQTESPAMASMLYPGLQALDEEYLKVDAQFGGVDQRKIFMFAREKLPLLGYKKRIHLMNPMVPGLTGTKMSASDANSKVDILETTSALKKKIKGAFCPEGVVENNGVLAFVKSVLFPLGQSGTFTITRKEEHGGNVTFTSYADLEVAFVSKEVHPGDLKLAVAASLDAMLDPIRKQFAASADLQQLVANAYPAAKPAEAVAATPGGFGSLDLRVGVVTSVEMHKDADTLYVEEVDIGEDRPRQIVSGLVKHVPLEQMTGRKVVVLCNMKPQKMRGIESSGMLLCATTLDNSKVEPLVPPEGSKPGDVIVVQGHDRVKEMQILNPKKKIFEKVAQDLTTTQSLEATFKGLSLKTSSGPITASSLVAAKIR